MDKGSKIFISYSHQDHMCASGIGKYLLRKGYDVWIDSTQLVLGKEWAVDIDYALRESDAVLAILSSNSVRRREVLREIYVALERMKSDADKGFRLYFIVLGSIHPAWFCNSKTSNNVQEILDYLQKYQFVQLDSRGDITIEAMNQLITVLRANGLLSNDFHTDIKKFDDAEEYIYENGMPEKVYDNQGDNYYYKVRPSDLAPSTVFPFALDNQWLPEYVMENKSELKQAFLAEGFASIKVRDYMVDYQRDNFYLSLFHSRQVIVNRAAILNSVYLRKLYMTDKKEDNKELWRKERLAFRKFLSTGAIVIFLYGDNEISPFVNNLPKYSIEEKAVKAWNRTCHKNAIYCIREDWDNPIDQHSIEILRYCITLSIDREKNMMLADSMGFNSVEREDFLETINDIEMQVYCQTNMSGTKRKKGVKGYSRSTFYKNYVVRDEASANDAVLNCLFDDEKPFSVSLKKMIDIFYNSIFSNYFKCWALMPYDTKPEDIYIHQMHLHHGEKEVGVDELQYALSELFEHNNLHELIEAMGSRILLQNWTLSDIAKFRGLSEWLAYIELLELINKRSSSWKVDFSEIEMLVKRFSECINKFSYKKEERKINPSFSFRVCIGSKVLDIVSTSKIGKLKQYVGSYNNNGQNALSIQFQIGDISLRESEHNIFLPIVLFDGKTNHMGGQVYFTELCKFLIEQHGFIWVND